MRVYPFFIPHAGCPHRCRFCQQQRISGSDAAPAPEQVGRELAKLLPERGAGEVAFYGGSFTLLEPALQQAYMRRVEPFIAQGRVAGIRVSTRPDAIDEQQAALLQRGGVTTVELGCQSFSAAVLAAARRGHGPEAAGRAVPVLRSRSLQVGLQLMPGLPGGGRQEALLSLRAALDLQPDFLRIYPTVVLRDTALADDFLAGVYRPFDLEEAVDLCAELLWHCRQAAVPVIRLGLQASAELASPHNLIAGPYHPAFGALVRARLWRRAFESVGTGRERLAVRLHSADLSDALGNRRANQEYFQERGRPLDIRCDEALARGMFAVGDRIHCLQEAAVFAALPSTL